MMIPCNDKADSSRHPLYFWSSSTWNLLLILVIPLFLFSLLVSTFVIPQPSTLSPLSSPWTWRFSADISNGSSTDSSSMVAETHKHAANMSFSDAFLDKDMDNNITSTTRRVAKRISKLEKLEANMAKARSSIKEAARVRNLTSVHQDPDYVPHGPIYRNANAFHR
ncbi:hypothetical protein V6N13_087431 [Hibiscus sabdariffa]